MRLLLPKPVWSSPNRPSKVLRSSSMPARSTPARRLAVASESSNVTVKFVVCPSVWIAIATSSGKGSADFGADAVVQAGQLLGNGVDGSRAGLEDGRGVERHPAKTHLLERGDAVQHGVVVRIEGLAGRVARWRRHHALQSDRVRIAARFFRVA